MGQLAASLAVTNFTNLLQSSGSAVGFEQAATSAKGPIAPWTDCRDLFARAPPLHPRMTVIHSNAGVPAQDNLEMASKGCG